MVKTAHLKLVRPQAAEDLVGHLTPAGRDLVQAALALAESWYGEARLASVEVIAKKRAGLLRDIADALARERIRIVGSRSAEEEAAVRVRYTLEVADLGQLGRVLTLIREVRGVARAARR